MKVWRKPLVGAILVAAWAGTPGPAAAGPYDGSRPLLCAVMTIVECDSSGGCERQRPDGVNAPRFIRIDVASQTVTAGDNRRSSLRSVTRLDGELILQGGENGRGWSATIDEETGRMAAAVVDNDHTFSLFGGCTLP